MKRRVAGIPPANLTIGVKLLDLAKGVRAKLPQALNEHMVQLVGDAKSKKWLATNLDAIDAFNARVKRDGIWSDKFRSF